MSSRISELRTLFVEYFPDKFESGILYVSMKYAICGHLCACGCGEKVITPLSPKQWKIAYNGEDVTLYPSIGNYAFACQSHYFLTNGNIIWVDGRTAPYEGCWKGKYLSEVRGALEYDIEEFHLDTLEKKTYKVTLDSTSPITVDDITNLVDYIDPNLIKKFNNNKDDIPTPSN